MIAPSFSTLLVAVVAALCFCKIPSLVFLTRSIFWLAVLFIIFLKISFESQNICFFHFYFVLLRITTFSLENWNFSLSGLSSHQLHSLFSLSTPHHNRNNFLFYLFFTTLCSYQQDDCLLSLRQLIWVIKVRIILVSPLIKSIVTRLIFFLI